MKMLIQNTTCRIINHNMQVALLRLDIYTIQYHKFTFYIASRLQNYGVYRQLQLLLTIHYVQTTTNAVFYN